MFCRDVISDMGSSMRERQTFPLGRSLLPPNHGSAMNPDRVVFLCFSREMSGVTNLFQPEKIYTLVCWRWRTKSRLTGRTLALLISGLLIALRWFSDDEDYVDNPDSSFTRAKMNWQHACRSQDEKKILRLDVFQTWNSSWYFYAMSLIHSSIN